MPLYYKLIPNDGFDYVKFVDDYANGKIPSLRNCQIQEFSDPIYEFKNEIIDFVNKHGFDKIINRGLITEEVIPVGIPSNSIVTKFERYFQAIGKDKKYCVIDPYIFPNNFDANYIQLLNDVFMSAGSVKELKIVTSSKANNQIIKTSLMASLGQLIPGISISFGICDEYHDRYWINTDDETGFTVGSSLNGLGKKYASLSYFDKADVISVIADLKARTLL